MTATGAQTMGCSYASVVAQTEDTGENMEVDGPSRASGGELGASRGGSEKPADPAACYAHLSSCSKYMYIHTYAHTITSEYITSV